MRPQAHLPVPRGPTNTRATATGARLPISRVPRRILRKAMALSRVRLGRWLLTNTTVAETTADGPAPRTITRVATVARRLPRLPVTTTVTRRILRAIRMTAGTCFFVLGSFSRSRDANSFSNLLCSLSFCLSFYLCPAQITKIVSGIVRIVDGANQIQSRNNRII